MRWPVADKNKPRAASLIAGLFGVLASLWIAPAAGAVDTQIGVNICGPNSPIASISITEPTTDSIVNQATITFRGTVANASQIEIDVDGQYSGTLAIGANQTSFSTDVTLIQGTHTVLMAANDICGGQDATDSIVLTYAPTIDEPTNGGTTPTEINQPPADEPTVTPPISKDDIVEQIEQVPVIGSVVGIVADFATATGLSATVATTNVVSGVSRVGLTVAAMTSVVMASSLAPVAAQSVPGVSQLFNIASHRSMLYLGWAIRGAGILVMALAYFI